MDVVGRVALVAGALLVLHGAYHLGVIRPRKRLRLALDRYVRDTEAARSAEERALRALREDLAPALEAPDLGARPAAEREGLAQALRERVARDLHESLDLLRRVEVGQPDLARFHGAALQVGQDLEDGVESLARGLDRGDQALLAAGFQRVLAGQQRGDEARGLFEALCRRAAR